MIIGVGIAHVPENRRLFPGMTVEDNLKLGAFAKTARGDSAKKILSLFMNYFQE